MTAHDGGCLCGQLRYRVSTDPLWVTVCHCRFCQRATGATHLVEPVFDRGAFRVTSGTATVFSLTSAGSGKRVDIHHCRDCATKVALTFERWPDRLGVYAGTFDDPGWFAMTPDNTKHIFVAEAPRGTIIPAGYNAFDRHAAEADGTPLVPTVHATPHVIA